MLGIHRNLFPAKYGLGKIPGDSVFQESAQMIS